MRIFIHSWRQIFGNLGIAVQISWPIPALFALQFILVMNGIIPDIGMSFDPTAPGAASLGMLVFVAILVYLLVAIGIAIAWHRFVLHGTQPGQGLLRDAPISGYFGRSLLIGLIVVVPVSIVLGGLLGIAGQTGGVAVLILQLAFNVVVLTLTARFSLILPALAIGERMTLGESWRRTQPVWSDIMVTMAVFVLIQNGGVILILLGVTSFVLLHIVSAALAWLTTILGLSILTTLYGHLVENRPLNA